MSNITKSYLEEVIEKKAQERVDNDFKNLKQAILSNPIGGAGFGIVIGEKPGAEGMVDRIMPIAQHGNTWTILDQSSDGPVTNIDRIKATLLEKYKKEELDNILKKLDGVQYLFEQSGL